MVAFLDREMPDFMWACQLYIKRIYDMIYDMLLDQCWQGKYFSLANQIKFTIEAG